MEIIAYHGTDYNAACNIQKYGFIYRPNESHWLGNGIYLYQDYSLAKWWTTNPSSVFGTKVNNPAIIKCTLSFDADRILNLMKLEDYMDFSEIFEKEFFPMYKSSPSLTIPHWKKMRCMYCDFLKKTYQLDAIIGNFNIPTQPYLPPKHQNMFDDFLLQYTEVQICVFNKNIISNMSVEKL